MELADSQSGRSLSISSSTPRRTRSRQSRLRRGHAAALGDLMQQFSGRRTGVDRYDVLVDERVPRRRPRSGRPGPPPPPRRSRPCRCASASTSSRSRRRAPDRADPQDRRRAALPLEPPGRTEHAVDEQVAHETARREHRVPGKVGRDDPSRGRHARAGRCRTRRGSEPEPGRLDPGRGASGRSKSSLPVARRGTSTSCGRSRSTTVLQPVSPDQFWMSHTDAGPNAPR